MSIKNIRKLRAAACCLALSAAILAAPVGTAISACSETLAATRQDIDESKKKISSNKAKIEEIKKDKVQVDKKLSDLQKLKSDASAYISKLDAEIAELDGKLQKLGEEIETITGEEEQVRAALEDANARERRQYEMMKIRIRYMYEKGKLSEVDTLLSSGSLTDLLNKTEYVQQVSRYDRLKLDEYMEVIEEIRVRKEELEVKQEELSVTKAKAEEERQAVVSLEADKKKELSGYESKIRAAESELSEMQSDIAGLQAAIKAEEGHMAAIEAEIRRQEEEARKKAEAEGKSYTPKTIGSISFTWPLPGQSRITSSFGDRESPTEGASTNHKGVDVGAPSGTPIVAAAEGTVVIATYSASAGNYVMINHGGGVYTVYMHMSSIGVSKGASVSKGQKIGAVGSTGYSTGPHLHFGIRVDGSYVNPLSYARP